MKILPNGVAVMDGDTHHGVWCATEGLVHDKFAAGVIRRALLDRPEPWAVDGGANIGTLARAMLDAGKQVLAFEPEPEAVACLRHNCPEAEIHPVALGVEPGEVCLQYHGGNKGATNVAPGIGVPVKPLDAYCENLEIGFIKLDVEGYELFALRGAVATIARCRPTLYVEVNEGALERAGASRAALLSYITEAGYVWRIAQPDCKATDPMFDLLCCPLEKLADGRK